MPPPVTVSPRCLALDLSHSQFELAMAMGRDAANAGIDGFAVVKVEVLATPDQATDECCSGCLISGPSSRSTTP